MNDFKYSIELEKQNIFICEYIHKIGGYRYNWHNEIEIMLILKGKVEVCVEGDIYQLKEGDIILINANYGHASLKKEEESIALVLHINPIYLNTFYNEDKSLKFSCISNDETRDSEKFVLMRECMINMIKSISKNTVESRFETIGNLGILVSHLLKHFPPEEVDIKSTSKEFNQSELIKKIINYIEKNYYKKVSLNDISNLINYNPNYTSSFFKANVGINFYDYLSRIRLKYAISELITTNKTISTIAIENGFSDVKIFNNYFKKNFNQSPNEYRNKNSKMDPMLSSLNRNYISVEEEIVKKQFAKLCKYNNENIMQNHEEKYVQNEIDKDESVNFEIELIDKEKDEIIKILKNLDIKVKIEKKNKM